MRKVIVGIAVLGAGVVALRRFGPALGRRAMSKCEQMFDRMPEDFPPKRMVRGIDEIREQNARILHLFEEGQPVAAFSGGR